MAEVSKRPVRPMAYSTACHQFVDQSGVQAIKTVIMITTKFSENNSDTEVTWACNRGYSCYDVDCRFSHVGIREEPTVSRKVRRTQPQKKDRAG